jgi:hypothetical protein
MSFREQNLAMLSGPPPYYMILRPSASQVRVRAETAKRDVPEAHLARTKISASRRTATDPVGNPARTVEPAILSRGDISTLRLSTGLDGYTHAYIPSGASSSMMEVMGSQGGLTTFRPMDIPADRLVRYPAGSQVYPLNLTKPVLRERTRVFNRNQVRPTSFGLQSSDVVMAVDGDYMSEGTVMADGITVSLQANPPTSEVDIFVMTRQ